MQKSIYIVGRLCFAILFCLLVDSIAAQQNKLHRKDFLANYVFKGNHVQFNFATLSTFRAGLKNEAGSHPVSTRPALGFLFSFKYQVNFNNEYSLITGPEANLLGRNLITSFVKNDFSPPLIEDYELKGINSYLAVFVISLPVLMEKRWLYAGTKFFYVDGGLRLNASTGADFDFFSINLQHTGNGYHDAGGTDVYANNDAKPWISFPVNAGHVWLLKNNNLLQLSIYSNISFTKYVNGTYRIIIPGKPLTEGRYSSTGSFIGLSMNYVFTNANYRIRKAYEKIRQSQ
jgi:hypothetical protein